MAHFLLHSDQIGSGIEDDVLYRSSLSDRREAEANRLAADILMPHELVEEFLETAKALSIDDIPSYLADQFEVSEAAMKIRLGIS
ncbi:ImmA/IrrE family metallo-endopeptidase [Acidisoma silvae]|uniref:ImmA/IrrE family metallo-endopeptidase n=1 Tax=Acidisoma silvae TaxID=2802396 RepID=A0A963YV69_9PROT|nr:ImmA/IrrE family metallo-endopeptidase [Acidisoma silvae]